MDDSFCTKTQRRKRKCAPGLKAVVFLAANGRNVDVPLSSLS